MKIADVLHETNSSSDWIPSEKFIKALTNWKETHYHQLEEKDLEPLKEGMQPLKRDVTAYRGCGFHTDAAKRGHVQDFRIEDRIKFNSFLPLTLCISQAKEFMKTEWRDYSNVYALYTVKLKKHTPCIIVADHMPNDEEEEIILPPGAEFQVTSREKQSTSPRWPDEDPNDEWWKTILPDEADHEWWKISLEYMNPYGKTDQIK